MVTKMLTIFAIIFALGTEAKKLPLPPQHPYMMHVSLQFNEENITQFIAESLFASNGLTAEPTAAQCNISLFDIVDAIPFKKMTDADLSSAFGSLGIVLEDDDIQMFMKNMNYTELSNMGFSVSRMFKTFVKTYFTTGTTQLLSVLEAFDVGEVFTVAYAFGTDEEMFNALKEAEFSPDTIAEVEALLNITFTIKDISNILGIKKFDSLYVQNFVNINITNFLLTKELQQVNFEAFLSALNFSLHDYKDIKSFKTCYKTLTQTKALAVAISPSEIITNDDTVLQNYLSLRAFTTLNIASVQDKKSTFTVASHNTTGNGFTKFTVTGPIISYIDETTSYDGVATKACTYVTENTKNLVSQPAAVQMSNNQLAMAKLPGTTFKKASPIVCDGKLFGLAATEDISSISFSVFEVLEQPKEIITPTLAEESVTVQPEVIITTQPEVPVTEFSQNPEVMAMVNELFQNFLLTFNPCNYMVCSTPAPEVSVAPEQEVQKPELSEPQMVLVEEETVPEQVGAEIPKEPLPVEVELGNQLPAEPVPAIDQPAIIELVVPEVEVQKPSSPNDLLEVVGPLEEVHQIVVVQEPIIPVAEVQEAEISQVPVGEQSQLDKEVQGPIIPIAEVQEPKVSPAPGTQQSIVVNVVLEGEVQAPSSPNALPEVVGPQEEVQQIVTVQEPTIPVVEVQEPKVSPAPGTQQSIIENVVLEGEVQEPASPNDLPEVVGPQEEVQQIVAVQEPIIPVAEVQDLKVSPAPGTQQSIVENVVLEGEVQAPSSPNALPEVVGPQEEVQQIVALQEPIIPVVEVQDPKVSPAPDTQQSIVENVVLEGEVQEPSSPNDLPEVVGPQDEVQQIVAVQEPIIPVAEVQEPKVSPAPGPQQSIVENVVLVGDIQEPSSPNDLPEVVGLQEVVQQTVLVQEPIIPVAEAQEPEVSQVPVGEQSQLDKEVQEPIIPVAEIQEPKVSPAPGTEQPIVHVVQASEGQEPSSPNDLPQGVGLQAVVQQIVEPVVTVAEVQEPELSQVVDDQTQLNKEMEPIIPIAEAQEPEVSQVLAKEQSQGAQNIEELAVQETVPEAIIPESLMEEPVVEGQSVALPISDLQAVVLPESVQDSSVVVPELQGSSVALEGESVALSDQAPVLVEEVVKADSLTEDVVQEVVLQDLAQVQEPKVQVIVEDQTQVDKELHAPVIPVAEAEEPEVSQVVLGEQSQGVENMRESAVHETVPEEVIPGSLMEEAVVVQEVVVQDAVQEESLATEQLVGEPVLQ